MTTICAIRVPGQGAVLVADGKVSDETGRIWTTTAKKLLPLATTTVGCSGNLLVLDELKRAQPITGDEVKDFIRDSAHLTPFELVCYDRLTDQLWTLDQNGMYVEYPHWVALGVGGQIASGALMMAAPPTNLDVALVLGRQAIRASAVLNGFCGGVTHWAIAQRVKPDVAAKKKTVEFHGVITQFNTETDSGSLRIGKRSFSFHASTFKGRVKQPYPAEKMKVAVDISSTGAVLSVRPSKP